MSVSPPRSTSAKRLTRADRAVAALVVLLGGVVATLFSLGQWRMLQTPSWDLAIFSQLSKAYAAGQAPIVPIKGEGFNLLGDHFHPILILLGPLWRLWPSPVTLLVLQNLLLALSAWPLVRLATDQLRIALDALLPQTASPMNSGSTLSSAARLATSSSPAPSASSDSTAAIPGSPFLIHHWLRLWIPRVLAAALALAYVFSWGIQGAVAAQFHEIAFAVPFLAWGSVAYVRRRYLTSALWLAPLVLVKEDLGLTVMMAGLVIAWTAWREGRGGTSSMPDVRIGLVLVTFGLAAFLLTVLVFLPALSPTDAWQYGLSGNANDGSQVTASNSNLLARVFSPSVKLATLLLLVLTAGGIGLASPWMLLALPTLAWRFLSPKSTYWVWDYWHYNAVLMPIAFGALLDSLGRLCSWIIRHFLSDAERPVRRSVAARPVVALVSLAIGLPVLTGALISPQLPYHWMQHEGWGQISSRTAAVEEIEGLIATGQTSEFQLSAAGRVVKSEASSSTGGDTSDSTGSASTVSGSTSSSSNTRTPSVLSDLTLLARLVPVAEVHWIGTSSSPADYVVVDTYSSSWGGRAPANAAQWAQQKTGASYELVYQRDGFQVARRISPN